MKFSEDITELAKALAKAQNSLKNPNNTANNPYFKSKYAPLPDVLNDIRPILSENGISVVQSPVTDGAGSTGVETMLLHTSGQYILTDPYFLKPVKNDPQTAGGAITYARRYALNAVLGISGEEDDDGNSASAKNELNPQNKATKQAASRLGQQQTDPRDKPYQYTPKEQQNTAIQNPNACSACGGSVTEAECKYSMTNFNRILCRTCQRGFAHR